MNQPLTARRRRIVDPTIQLRFVLLFASIAAAAVVVETVVLQFMLRKAARALPNDTVHLIDATPQIVLLASLLTFVMLVPIAVAMGVRATFPVVGPIYRFRQFLRDVRDGKQAAPCKIRSGDDLTDVCELLNEVTEETRNRIASRDAAGETDTTVRARTVPSSSRCPVVPQEAP